MDTGLPLDFGTTDTTTSFPGLRTSTTTTAALPQPRSVRSRSPGPRACNLVSSMEDVWAAELRIFAVCGHCRPRKVVVSSPARLEDVMVHLTIAFADMGVLPDVAIWLLSSRVHWLWDGALRLFLTTGWGSLEPRYVALWIEPGHRWHEPFVVSVPNYASRAQILACVHIQGLDAAVLTIDGILWDGLPRVFHNGEVLQVRSSWHRMGTIPTHLVGDRVWGLMAFHCGLSGPARVKLDPLYGVARAGHIRAHFEALLRPFMCRFLPSATMCNVFLVVQTGPFMCLSLGTRLPPDVGIVQQFYDDFVLPVHGPRCVEDAKLVWDDACIFLARTPEYPCHIWLLLGSPSFDSIQLADNQDLSQLPSPPGRIWYPGETKGNVGIAFLQDIELAGDCPGPSRLHCLSARRRTSRVLF